MRQVTIAWAYIGKGNEIVENEDIAKAKVLAAYPDAVFDDWNECQEPEASETEEVMWVQVRGVPVLALYQE